MNRTCETPASRAIRRTSSEPPGDEPIDVAWEELASVVALFFLHALRSPTPPVAPAPRERVRTFLELTRSARDEAIAGFMKDRLLVSIDVDARYPLFVPETGFFSVPVRDPSCATGWTFGYGLPIAKRRLLALVSNGADKAMLDSVRQGPFFATMSLGSEPACQRWIVPPEYVMGIGEDATARAIERGKRDAIDRTTCTRVARDQLASLFAAAGLGARVRTSDGGWHRERENA